MMDCQWIAELLRHGLLRGSYVPSAVIRDLRDLTRTRATLSQEQSGISSRIQKLLESANIKLGSTVIRFLNSLTSGRSLLPAFNLRQIAVFLPHLCRHFVPATTRNQNVFLRFAQSKETRPC